MPHRHIALFTEMLDFDESYMDLVWRAADRRASERDCHLFVCVGRRIDRQEPENFPQTTLYSLAMKRKFDAFIISQSVYQRSEQEQRDQFGALFKGLPCAANSIPLQGVPTILFDNEPPMRALMRHLIHEHKFTRILVVAGSPEFSEAQTRFNVWKDEMTKAGLNCGPEMVVQGHFQPSYAPLLPYEVYDRVKQTKAEAIVVCSDLTAAQIIRGLYDLGMQVPKDVAVTGYDDIMLSRFINPPITTIRQPIFEQMMEVTDLALSQQSGESYQIPEMVGKLIVRGSCGCPLDRWADEPETKDDSPEMKALATLRKMANACEVPLDDLRSSLALAHERTRFLRSRVSELNIFARRIDEAEKVDSLVQLLNEWMPRLGITTFALSLACDAQGNLQPHQVNSDQVKGLLPQGPQWHRLLVCNPPIPGEVGPVFPASDLVPDSWLSQLPRSTLVVLPLAMSNTWYGLAAMVISQEGNLMCRSVQELTASFIDREFRLREMVRKNLETRIGAQMEAEKMQTITTLIAGVAHDMATPLGVSRTSADYLRENFRNLRSIFESGDMTQTSLQEFLDDGDSALKIMSSSVERSIEQVKSFKRVSTEVPREDLRSFKIVGFLRDILKNLGPMWRHRSVRVQLSGPEDLEITTHAVAFLDILTNLIQNSLIHAWPDNATGSVEISVGALTGKPDTIVLSYHDDGVGIAPDLLPLIFEPFFTTKENQGGTGLGLHIIQHRVQTLLSGVVRCESCLGKGTSFIIEFPRILAL